MSLKDKLNIIKEGVFSALPTAKSLPVTYAKNDLKVLDDMDSELDKLLEEESSLVNKTLNYTKDVIRLIVLLDISNSMNGTEKDIYLGLKDLVEKHRDDNILVNFVVFNGERYVLLDDVYIGSVEIPKIETIGSTNLNGSLYYTIKDKCSEGVNLLVTISDGEDTVKEKTVKDVKDLMASIRNEHNHFYFLGEPNERQTPEEVFENAQELGFNWDNIAIFTRLGNGNKLNFAVISQMLDELIEYGKISSTWSKPIKEHYLALTDKRR